VAAKLVFKLIGYLPIEELERFVELPLNDSSEARSPANGRTCER